jgi:hypothetical protein
MGVTAAYDKVGVLNSENEVINPATDESVLLLLSSEIAIRLRQITKAIESIATVDIRNRQRIVIDGVGVGTTGVTTETAGFVPIGGTTLGPAMVCNGASNSGPFTTTSINTQPVIEGPVDQRWRVAEDSHISYQIGIRSHLSFT